LISGPNKSDIGPRTDAQGNELFITTESPDILLDRLGLSKVFVKLTRPNLSPVWIRGFSVVEIRHPIATEMPGNAVVNIGGFHLTVNEDVETVLKKVNDTSTSGGRQKN
jgi:hypothetical protein